MIRNKTYAIYQGMECEIGYTTEDGYYVLFRKESVDKNLELELNNDGFELTEGGNFFKPHITKEEVTEVYSIETSAIYEGRTYHIENERNHEGVQEYLLVRQSKSEADEAYFKSSGFNVRDVRGKDYCKWISLNEIEKIYEEKKHIRYFRFPERIGGDGTIEKIVLHKKS